MNKYYIPLEEVTDFIDSINGEAIEQEAGDLSSPYAIENDTELTYPDLVWESEDEITEAVVNGDITSVYPIIGGAHPPTRPR